MKDAAFAFVIKQNELLLTKRRDVPLWVLPGGGIEAGETAEEAAIRETKEETGCDIRLLTKTHEMWPINKLAVSTHLFIAEPLNEPLSSSTETSQNRFFPLRELPKTLFAPHRLWIEEALATTHLIKRPLSEITYRGAFLYFLRNPLQTLRYLFTRFTKA